MPNAQVESRPESFVRRRMYWWHAFVLCAGAAAIVWCVSAVWDTRGPDRVTGPYHVPLAVETPMGVLAVIGSVIVVVALARQRRGSENGASYGTAGVLILASVAATGAWRVTTAMGEGANIGAGLLVLVAPFPLAALLFAAVCIQRATGGVQARFAMWCTLAWLTGPVLFVADLNLGS